MQNQFEYLNGLIDACFHQDMDIWGTNLAEVVHAYAVALNELNHIGTEMLKADIISYLAVHPNNDQLEKDFYSRFQWGLVPDAFGKPRQFLTTVLELLATT